MPRTTIIMLITLAITSSACREIHNYGSRAVFSGDSSPAGVRAMTRKCQKIKTGMTRSGVEMILGFSPQVQQGADGAQFQEWAFGGVEENGGCMRIVYGTDGRVSESRLDRWR